MLKKLCDVVDASCHAFRRILSPQTRRACSITRRKTLVLLTFPFFLFIKNRELDCYLAVAKLKLTILAMFYDSFFGGLMSAR